MLIADAHLDLAWNAVGWNRDLTRSLAEVRQSEAGMPGKARGLNTVTLPEMRRGEVGICLATLLARVNPAARDPVLDFRAPEIACAVAMGHLSYYKLLQERGWCKLIGNRRALQEQVAGWTSAPEQQPLGFIVSMEGADPILSPDQLPQWFDLGLRVIGLAHYGPGIYAHGTASSGGLTAAGRDLLRAMSEVGMVLDMTHLADESFWEAAELFEGPVLASHNNCRSLVPGDRQFDDDQIRFLIQRGGVIGSVFDIWMLAPGWSSAKASEFNVKLESVIDHMDHICEVAGGTGNVAIGSDLDGGYGTEQSPSDLDSIADLQKLAPLLRRRGYSDSDVAAIFHGNWLNFFERAWRDTRADA